MISKKDIPVRFVRAHWNTITGCMIQSYWTPDLQGQIDIYSCNTPDEARAMGVELIEEGLAYLDSLDAGGPAPPWLDEVDARLGANLYA